MSGGFAPSVVILDETASWRTSSDDDDLEHVYCECDEDRALCGADVSDVPITGWDGPDDDLCVVCADLAPMPCERCGAA